jgi:glycosyltransferase involved in cell wall biosynthesis
VKVVHLVQSGDVAGGQLVALRLARAARDRGLDVALVSPTRGPFVDLARREGMEATILPIRGALDLAAVGRLRRHLRTERADVLHTHAHFSLNVVGRVAARLAGARVVAHMHIENAFRPAGVGRTAQVVLDNASARLCSWIVAVSEATRTALVRQGYPAKRTVTIYNGVDPAPAVDSGRADDRPPQLLEVARLCDVKGQRELIAALEGLRRRDAVLLLAGDDLEAGGAFRRALEVEAEQQGLGDRVRLLGHRDDVRRLIGDADVMVLPSHAEGLPLVVLEAMAAAKPVVATAVGGVPELVVDGETGLLVPPGDVEALTRALDDLLGDPDRARRLGEAGRRRALEKFSADEAAARVLELYGR